MKPGTFAAKAGKNIRRRALLGGALASSLALPWLEITAKLERADAQAMPSPNGFWFSSCRVGVSRAVSGRRHERDRLHAYFHFAAARPLQESNALLDGIEVPTMAEGFGHPHARGMTALLTGVSLPKGPYDFFIGGPAGFPDSTSLDHVIGNRIGADNKFKTLEFGVLWPDLPKRSVADQHHQLLRSRAARASHGRPLPCLHATFLRHGEHRGASRSRTGTQSQNAAWHSTPRP